MNDRERAAAGLSSPARPLEAGVRDQLSACFGHDFSTVRVHVGPEADTAARGLDARAFTVGNDVVFSHGAYDPLTAAGRRLIAHELAHVAQHRGSAHAPNFLARQGAAVPAASAPLERQADLAAALSDRPLPRAWAWERATAPFLGRVEQDWKPFDVPYAKDIRRITAVQRLPSEPSAVAVDLGAFVVPTAKGPWRERYDAIAKARGLQATIDVTRTSIRTGVWEKRAPTEQLRRLWLQRVQWPTDLAQRWWHEAGGSPPASGEFKPQTRGGTAEIDHIVELQLGGTNVPENLAPHDMSHNRSSGATIWQNLRETAQALVDQLRVQPKQAPVTSLTLRFSSAEQKTAYPESEPLPTLPVAKEARPAVIAARRGAAGHAVEVHATALNDLAAGSRPDPEEQQAQSGQLAARVDYPLTAGPSTATLRVPPTITDEDPIEGDVLNDPARELIPGLVLGTLRRTADKRNDLVIGWLNSEDHPARAGTRLPMAIQEPKDKQVVFKVTDVGVTGKLALRGGPKKKLLFFYPYLSSATMDLEMTAEGLVGKGKLTPSVPLLSKVAIDVTLDRNGLHGAATAPKDKLSLPPFTVTEAALKVELGTPPSVTGDLSFTLGSLVTGEVKAGLDESGFFARGTVSATVPGLDKASGELEYRPGTGLTGHVEALASASGGLVRSGSVRIDLADGAWTAAGLIGLMLPGEQPAELSVVKKGERIVYAGHTVLRVPGLDPVDITLSYDGQHVTGSASTAFTVLGLKGTVLLAYHDGVFTGTGSVRIDRGRVSGSITATLDEQGRISGKGVASVEIRPGLVGTVGVELTPEQELRVSGEVSIPDYQFLSKHGGRYVLFQRDLPDIPLFAIPLGFGSVGLIARIGAGLAVEYSYGPGEIRGMKIGAAFNPLAKDSALDVAARAQLVLPASAGVELSLRAAAGLSVIVASITGGITVTGGVHLAGGLDAKVALSYAKQVLVLDAEAAIRVRPVLTLGISADITAEASLLGTKRWPYKLASYAYPLGLEFGMVVPFHYQSDKTLQPPQAKDIRWIVPDINVRSLTSSLAGRVRTGLGL
ncbi:eCIS core domain-containing protein [Streptomyces decoyicus]